MLALYTHNVFKISLASRMIAIVAAAAAAPPSSETLGCVLPEPKRVISTRPLPP
jgi:hypothetical protein